MRLHRYKSIVREGTELAIALTQFRSLLKSKMNEIVTIGWHFNTALLYRAFEIYDDHYHDYFGSDWSDPRATLFWQQVIGYIQRFLPANYLQAFCDGLYKTEKKLRNGSPQNRSFKLNRYDWDWCSWILADLYPRLASSLGFDFAILACETNSKASHRAWCMRFEARDQPRAFLNLMSIKSSRHTELAQHQSEKSKSSCLVM